MPIKMISLHTIFLVYVGISLASSQSFCRSLIRDCHTDAGQMSPNDFGLLFEFANYPLEEQEKLWRDACSSLKDVDSCFDALDTRCRGEVESSKYFNSHLCTQSYKMSFSGVFCTGAVQQAADSGRIPCWAAITRPSDTSTPDNFDFCSYYTQLGECTNTTIAQVCDGPVANSVAHVSAVSDLIKLNAVLGANANSCPLVTSNRIDESQSCPDRIQNCYGNQNARDVVNATDQTAAWETFCRVVEAGAGCVAAISDDCEPLADRVRHAYGRFCDSASEERESLGECLSAGVNDVDFLNNCHFSPSFDIWLRDKGPEVCLNYGGLLRCYNESFQENCPSSQVAELAGVFTTTSHLVTLWDYLKVCPIDFGQSDLCNSAHTFHKMGLVEFLSLAVAAIFVSLTHY